MTYDGEIDEAWDGAVHGTVELGTRTCTGL